MKSSKISLVLITAVLSGTSLWAQQNAATPQSAANAINLCDVAELDTKPKPIKRVQPLYPAELKAARVTGEVVVSFVVAADGSVKNVCVEKATDTAFGEAAAAAVSTWEFEPGYKNGVPVACKLNLPLRFALQN
jgi:protein TonB